MKLTSTTPKGLKRSALAVTLAYVAVVALWLVFSAGTLHVQTTGAPGRDRQIEFIAAWLLVLASAAGVFVLVWRLSLASWRNAQSDALRAAQPGELAGISERMQLLVEGTRQFFFYLQDLTGKVTYVSPTVEAITGYSVEEWVGQSHWFAPDTPAVSAARAATHRHLAGDFDRQTANFELRHKNGKLVILEAFESGRYENGVLVGLQGIAHDVTERLNTEKALYDSERRYRTLAEAAPDFIYILDPDCRVLYVNRAAAEVLRRPISEIVYRGLDEFFPPVIAAHQKASARRVFDSAEPIQLESSVEYPGRAAWLDTILVPILDESRNVEAVLGISRDVSERKRSELVQQALYKISQAANSALTIDELYPQIHAIVADLMPATNLYIALFDEATGTLSFPYWVDEHDPRPQPRRAGKGLTEYVLRTGQPFLARGTEWERATGQGEIELIGSLSVDWLGVPLKTSERTIGVLAVQSYAAGTRYGETERDLLVFVSTQVAMAIARTQAAEALRASEQRLRDIVEHSSNLFYSHTAEHVLTYVSPQSREFFGIEPKDALVRWTELITDNPVNQLGIELTQRAIDTGEPQPRYELELHGRDGTVLWAEVNEAPVVRDGQTVAIVGALTDITERKRVEAALRESEDRYRRLVELSPDAIAVHCEGKVVFANGAAAKLFGCASAAELLGREVLDFVHPDDRNEIRQRIRVVLEHQLAVPVLEERLLRRDGSVCEAEIAASPFTFRGKPAVQVVARDISVRRRIDEHLRQAQKLEAIGQLAGGVAHDFNNLLQAMLSAVQVLHVGASDPARIAQTVEEIEAHIRRGASLTRQLLLFSRREVTKPGRLDLNDVVRDTDELLQRLVRENIRTVTELAADQLPIDGDQSQIEQVLVNLAVNAIDAMPEGGTLGIRTGASEDEAWFEVSDTGIGIEPELQSRIFEPFFTTKSPGKGTGLGLSVVHGIVLKHGGRIELASTRGGGSTFRVVLPLQRHAYPSLPSHPPEPHVAPGQGQGERILLVEDERGAREGLREMLGLLGYQVTAVESAETAAALPIHPPFDLLLTDLLLPGLHGGELANDLLHRWPTLKVIVMSGYTEDEAIRRGVRHGNVRFLQKPFDLATLAHEVRAAFGETR